MNILNRLKGFINDFKTGVKLGYLTQIAMREGTEIPMIVSTKSEAKTTCNNILKNRVRYTKEHDADLFTTAYENLIINRPIFIRGLLIAEENVTVNNIPCTLRILYNPYAVYLMGSSIATCITDTVNQINILVDDDYLTLSDSSKEFTKYHELGHIVYNHVFIAGRRNIHNEYEADYYATKHSDNGTEALLEIKSKINNVSARVELTKRIAQINKEDLRAW